jgi:hypothetical protein
MRRQHRQSGRQSGLALLELSFSVLGITIAVLTAFDIARIFQAYFVLKEAAQVTARELTSLKGSGVKVDQDTRKRSFDWYVYGFGNGQMPKLRVQYTVQNLPEGQRPAECASAPKCEPMLAALSGDPPKGDIDFDRAKERYGDREIVSALSKADFSCSGGPYCIARSFAMPTPDPAPGSNSDLIKVSYAYWLPLTVLFNDSGHLIRIQASAERRIERELLDDQGFFRIQSFE